jgi:hypothetical protein
LHLLEGQSQSITEHCLAHAQHQPPHAHAPADVSVGWVG